MVWNSVTWVELDSERCEITEIHPHTDEKYGLEIKHPNAGRRKIFTKSRNGNWVWISPKDQNNGLKTGYIIKGDLLTKLREYSPESFKQALNQYKLMHPDKERRDAVNWLHDLIHKSVITHDSRSQEETE